MMLAVIQQPNGIALIFTSIMSTHLFRVDKTVSLKKPIILRINAGKSHWVSITLLQKGYQPPFAEKPLAENVVITPIQQVIDAYQGILKKL